MKKPRLLNLAAGVSLLLAIAIVFLWVRSYSRHESFARFWHTSTQQFAWGIQSRYSSLDFIIMRTLDTGAPTAPRYVYWDWTRNDSLNPLSLRWFPFPLVALQHRSDPRSSYGATELTIAYWLLLLPTLPLPLIAFVCHRRRRRRETNNFCPTCGYDLRATPDRCPECGLRQAQSSGPVKEMQKSEC